MHERLKRARMEAGHRTASHAIRRFGWKGSTYRAHENRQNQFDPETAKIYGCAYGVNPAWLLTGEGEMFAAVRRRRGEGVIASNFGGPNEQSNNQSPIAVIGKVAVGVWVEEFLAEHGRGAFEPSLFPPDNRFASTDQFDLFIEDASLDQFAKSGDFVRCVRFEASNFELRDGDLVVIERVREAALREITARRLKKNKGKSEFIFESNDPRMRETLVVNGDVPDPIAGVRALGTVLWKYRPA